MTESETQTAAVEPVDSHQSVALAGWRRAMLFGTGLGITIGERNLEVALVRARPSGPVLVAATTIADFRSRPAAEWGAEIARFLDASGERRLAATVVAPRSEVIVRLVGLPGVQEKDIANAIELQADTLHPYGDEEVAWGWSRAGSDSVLVGLVRKAVFDSYETLFAEAGVALAAVTFSSAVMHSALRVWSAPPAFLLCFAGRENGRTEVYGESPARAVYSAEFPWSSDRSLAVARGELRLAAHHPAYALSEVLPHPRGETGHASASSLAYAAAIAGAGSRAAEFANLLPEDRRASHGRLQYVIPAILGTLLALGLLAVFVIFPAYDQSRYRNDLNREIRGLEPTARRVQSTEARIQSDRNRVAVLDDFRGRAKADLDVLNELTRLLPQQVWTNTIEIYPDSVVLAGEADQAAPLLKLLDSSPLFQNSEFALSVTHSGANEQFRIKTMRRGRAGRTTP